jgi:phosphoserine phosphatase
VDEAVRAQQMKLWDLLEDAWREAGLDSVDDVIDLLHKKGIQVSSDAAHRWASERRVPTDTKAPSRRLLEQLASVTDRGDQILAERTRLQEMLKVASVGSAKASARSVSSETAYWFQVIPKQMTRDYMSVDLVSATSIGSSISGTMQRLHPADESTLRWEFSGLSQGNDAIFLTFGPTERNRAVSVGAVSLLTEWGRPLKYAGYYSRREHSTDPGWDLVNRRIEWHQQLPSRYLPRIALLDLDNTLVRGWSLLSWARSDDADGLSGIDALRAGLDDAEAQYAGRRISHDNFAVKTANLYAEMVSANDPHAIDDSVDNYVNKGFSRRLLPFTQSLLRILRLHDVAPVLVTGAPTELVARIATKLGIEEAHAMVVRDGTVIKNTGTTEGKREAIGTFDYSEREIVFAAGDSLSDMPLLATAGICMATAPLLADLSAGFAADKFAFDETTTAAAVSNWLESRLPPPIFPRIADT